MLPPRLAGFGGKGIRTPDFQLAKLALYQLSYAPALRIAECRLSMGDCKAQSAGAISRVPGKNSTPVICRPIRLPSRSSAVVPGDRALFPSTLWQLFKKGARRGPHHREMHRKWQRWSGQV